MLLTLFQNKPEDEHMFTASNSWTQFWHFSKNWKLKTASARLKWLASSNINCPIETLVPTFCCKSGTQRALHGFAQQISTQAESKPTKLPVKLPARQFTRIWTRGGDDQQYLKCRNCSRFLRTTCTLSTLGLQCLQHVQEIGKSIWRGTECQYILIQACQ